MRSAPVSALCGRYIVFSVADQSYAIPLASVQEVVPIAELTHPPGAPALLAGFLDISGQLVAVVSLRRLWGMADQEPELYTPLIVLKATIGRLAFWVDRVAQIVALGEHDLISMDDVCSFNECAVATARVDGNSVVVLSPQRVLLKQEQSRFAQLADFERQRLLSLEGAVQ
jgi:purine-binding chemotaxis protein CheW